MIQTKSSHCYNTYCPGFVITSSKLPLDLLLKPYSTIGGEPLVSDFYIGQDATSGDWFLRWRSDGITMGFWPRKIFTNLVNSANYIEWGGEVYSPPDTIPPPMGSGELYNPPKENSGTDNEKSVSIGMVILVLSSPSLIIISLLLYKVVARFVRDKYRRKWVEKHLLPSLQQISYGEAIQLIDGRFEAIECSLCLDTFEQEDEIVTMLPGCNHIYRPNCIKDWLLKSTMLPTFPCCPVCKSSILLSS
ncbi:RING-H2 finger protein ATL11 [Linum grandiflorum]